MAEYSDEYLIALGRKEAEKRDAKKAVGRVRRAAIKELIDNHKPEFDKLVKKYDKSLR